VFSVEQAASVTTTTASAVEPSPFQSVPGGHSNPSATADTSQKVWRQLVASDNSADLVS